MNKRLILTAAVSMAMFLLTGCGNKLENKYTFTGNSIIDTADSGLFSDGFASELCVSETDADINTDNVDAAAFALFDVDNGSIVSQHNIYDRKYPASTTKILTCLLAIENGDLDDIVTVPDEAMIDVAGSSSADLKAGDQLTLKDLLYGLMLPSGNDAAVAIACHISGDTESFAELMNERARELGATGSNFINPNGLPDENHYTTVYDMYLIFNEAVKHQEFQDIAGSTEYSCTISNPSDTEETERNVTWTSSNAFLNGRFSFADGMEILCGKTGHTNAAGFCLVLGEADASGHRYISIIMDSPVYEGMYTSMRSLVEKHSAA